MAASNERIREVVDRYVELVATGTAAQIVELFAEGATVEDPIGSGVLTTREEITAFYARIEPLDQQTRLVTARICAGEAAFQIEIATRGRKKTYTIAPIDVMTFDDDGLVTSMRAYWAEEDAVVG